MAKQSCNVEAKTNELKNTRVNVEALSNMIDDLSVKGKPVDCNNLYHGV